MFIKVSETLSISSEHIEAIESVDDLNSLVHTTTKSFEVAMPRAVILTLLNSKSNVESKVDKLLREFKNSQADARLGQEA